ncbi:MAG TPA: hypothetical protein VOB72_19935, partial [Candidatus Dormibacteraeota bacterium]|nr:hypothetical protein [Candidatus Dormibacteraeota bacterium]
PLLAATGGAWAAAAVLLLAVQHPLWPHHAVVLVPALALLGGGLPRPRPAPLAAAAVAVLMVAAGVSAVLARGLQQPPPPGVAALRAATAPGDLVLTDDQYAAALAGRSVPPQLVDTSFVRVASGDLTAAQVKAIAERAGVRAVLLSTGRLAKLPGLRDWAAARFPADEDLGGGRTLYRRG